jgi:hypothetical protein
MKWSMLIILLVCPLGVSGLARAHDPSSDSARIAALEEQVRTLQVQVRQAKDDVSDSADKLSLMVLYMFFCGLWAHLAGRNFWLWFFLGFFNVLTLIALLLLAGRDWRRKLQAPAHAKPFD